MAVMRVEIVSAEREIFSGEAEAVFARLAMGEIGILPRHTPMLGRLKPGEVRVQTQAAEQLHFYVSGGLLEVQPGIVTVLADIAMRAHDLDEALAQQAVERAKEALSGRSGTIDYARARAELAEALARLQVARKLRSGAKR